MIPDVKFKNYYLQFIYSAKTDIVKYKNELEEIVINKEELYNYLDNNKQLLIEAYNINLDDYKIEWINKEYKNKCLQHTIEKRPQAMEQTTNHRAAPSPGVFLGEESILYTGKNIRRCCASGVFSCYAYL